MKKLVLGLFFFMLLFSNVWATKINLNYASKEELQSLPGIDSQIAEQILKYREKHGFFQNLEQLLEIKGIEPDKLQKIRPFITIEAIE